MSQPQRAPKAVTTAMVREDLSRIQAAVRKLLAEVPNLPGARPVEIAAALDIDLKLAWKIARIAQSGEPFAAVRHLPGTAGWRIAVEAAKKAGASSAAAAAATTTFERAIASGTEWAGDRRAFDIMAAGLASESDLRVDVEHRRQLYLGGSFVWGVRAQLAMRTDILAPSTVKRRMLDCATIRGFVGVERVRRDAPWRLEAPFVLDDSGNKPISVSVEPLDTRAVTERGDAAEGPHLLRNFCSEGVPPLEPALDRSSPRMLELADSEVGTEGRFDIVHGSVIRAVQPLKRSPKNHGIFQIFKQRTPAERAVFDLLVHRSAIPEGSQFEAILYSDLLARTTTAQRLSKDRIPISREVESLGKGLRRARLNGFDRYAELLAFAFARLDLDPAEFLMFRVETPYPPVPSTLALELPLKD